MEPTILQFILKLLYGCALGKHLKDSLLYLSLVGFFVQNFKRWTHLILVDVSLGNAIFPEIIGLLFAIYSNFNPFVIDRA
jgi:hypothetical protein